MYLVSYIKSKNLWVLSQGCICKSNDFLLKTFEIPQLSSFYLKVMKIYSFFCKICNKSFSDDLKLQKHLKKCDPQASIFHCKYCNKRFLKRSKLKLHEYQHDVQKKKNKASFIHCILQKIVVKSASHTYIHSALKRF